MARGWIEITAPKELILGLEQEYVDIFEGELATEFSSDIELLKGHHTEVRGTDDLGDLYFILRKNYIPYTVKYGAIGENDDCYGTEYVRYSQDGKVIVNDVPFMDGEPRVLLSDLREALNRGQKPLMDLINLEIDEKTILSWTESMAIQQKLNQQ